MQDEPFVTNVKSFTTLDDLKEFCVDVASLLDKNISYDHANAKVLIDYAFDLKGISGTMTTVLASAQYFLDDARHNNTIFVENDGKYAKLSVTGKKNCIDGLCKKERAVYALAERIEKRISSILDMIRSVISMYKEEVKASL